MQVLALTILLSLLLASIFVLCFVHELKKPRRRGIEHHALMPLEEDNFSPKKPSDHTP